MALANILTKLLLGRAFTAENGRITILGKYNLSLCESSGFALLIQRLCEEVGEKKAFEIIEKCGEIASINGTKAFGMQSPFLVLEKMFPFMDFYGWGKFSLVSRHEDEKTAHYIIKITNSPLTEYAKKEFGKNSKVCVLIRANLYAGIYLSLKKRPEVKEIACFCKGSDSCTFEIKVKK